jgi:hypothetical protein
MNEYEIDNQRGREGVSNRRDTVYATYSCSAMGSRRSM